MPRCWVGSGFDGRGQVPPSADQRTTGTNGWNHAALPGLRFRRVLRAGAERHGRFAVPEQVWRFTNSEQAMRTCRWVLSYRKLVATSNSEPYVCSSVRRSRLTAPNSTSADRLLLQWNHFFDIAIGAITNRFDGHSLFCCIPASHFWCIHSLLT